MGGFQRIPIAREHTPDRQTNKLQSSARKLAAGIDVILGNRQVVDMGWASAGDPHSTSDPTWNSAIDSFTTNSYKDSAKLIATNAKPIQRGDLIAVFGRYLYAIGASTTGTFRFVISDGNADVVLLASYRNDGLAETNAPSETIAGLVSIQNDMAAGACVMRMQGQRVAGAGVVQLLTTSGFLWAVLR